MNALAPMIDFALESLCVLSKCLAGVAILVAAVCVCVTLAGVARGLREHFRRQ